MADRFPLILNTSANQIQEIASGDQLNLSGNNIANAGVITATTFSGSIAGASNGILGIITAAAADIDDFVEVGSNIQLGNAGVITATTFKGTLEATSASFSSHIDANGDLDVDGHTNLDNVSIAGVTTLTGAVTANGAIDLNADLDVDGHTNLDNVNVAGIATVIDLDVDGHTNLDNVSVAGVTTFTSLVDANGGATIDNVRIGVAGNNEIDTSSGNLTLDSAAGTVVVDDSLNVNDSLTVTNTLNANGNIVGDSATNITGIAGVTASTFTGTLQTAAQPNITSVGTLGSLNVTGDVSVGGVLTYEDVTNVDSIGIITARTSIKLDADGSASSNFLSIGADDDLKIFHQSNVDKIESSGAGLHIRQINNGDLHIHAGANTGSANNRLVARAGGKAELYYGGALKLSTETGGVNITGVCTATSFVGNGSALSNLNIVTDTSPQLGGGLASNGYNINFADSNGAQDMVKFGGSGDGRIYHNGADLYIDNDTGGTWIGVDSGSTFGVGNGPAASPRSLRAVTGAQVDLYHNNNIKLTTSSSGVTITGTLTATSFSGDGSGLSNVGISTEQVTPSSNVATLNLAKDDHKIVASGTYTIDVSGGTEAESHTLRIENSGTANVGFSTYFKFPSGGTPSLPTASGAISLISFTIHKVGSVGIATVLLSGASVNYS